MALGVIGTMGAGCYVGFNSLNAYAVSSRLYSEAQTAAQNRIDLILSKEPFDPTKTPPKLPPDPQDPSGPSLLAIGTKTIPNVFIYRDPTKDAGISGNGNIVVTGTMTTTVTDTGATMTYAGSTTALNTYRVTVTVTYTYRNKTYNVSMDTMRTADQ